MKIELVSLDSLVPFVNNPRKSLNVDKVASSIKEFGFQQPIVINKDKTILAGHTRYYASKKLELKQVPCVIAELDDIRQKAYRIADNRVAEDNKWDFPTLNLEIEALQENNFNIDILGFEIDELKKFMNNPENFEPNSKDDQSNLDTETEGVCSKCGQELER